MARATHGSMFHRSPGSIGQSATPSKVLRGMRGPGHMGSRKTTVKNVRVVRVDSEKRSTSRARGGTRVAWVDPADSPIQVGALRIEGSIMPEIAVQNWKKKTLRTLELDEAVFDYPLKQHLIYEAVLAYQAAGRSGTHKTKNRIEVSGGTRKLWRQKGTGRARMGDNRSPLWRHGGTTHGPQPRDYSWRLPKKMRRNALRSILAQKLRDGELICLESLELDSHKTKALGGGDLQRPGLWRTRRFSFRWTMRTILTLAARNNPRLKVIRALGLNVVDLLQSDHVVFSEPALKRLNEVLAP